MQRRLLRCAHGILRLAGPEVESFQQTRKLDRLAARERQIRLSQSDIYELQDAASDREAEADGQTLM